MLPLILAGLGTLAGALALELGAAAANDEPWSPETAIFAFTASHGGNTDLWLQTGTRGDATRLTSDPAQDHIASWFPDGRHIAFQTLRDGQREIYVLDIDGGTTHRLTDDPAQDLLPDVSPDGRRIVFFSDRGIEHGERELPGNLYLMTVERDPLEEGTAERLTETPLTSTFGGDWSPDGRSILFARDFGGDIDLVVLDLETRGERRIEGTSADEYGGRFSPDGGRIAFHAVRDDGESRIVVMRTDGSERAELTSGAQHYNPQWSPDGEWLMFTGAPLGETRFDLLIVPAGGGAPRPLVATADDERSGAWAPEGTH